MPSTIHPEPRAGCVRSPSLSLPCRPASMSRKSTAARTQASASLLIRLTVSTMSASPARSASAMRKCASVFRWRNSIMMRASEASSCAARRPISSRIASRRASALVASSASSISGLRRARSRRKGDRSKTAARKSCSGPVFRSRAASPASPASVADSAISAISSAPRAALRGDSTIFGEESQFPPSSVSARLRRAIPASCVNPRPARGSP